MRDGFILDYRVDAGASEGVSGEALGASGVAGASVEASAATSCNGALQVGQVPASSAVYAQEGHL